MKPIGIVRRVDELGRVVLPKELRMIFDINPGDPMEIYTDIDNSIVLKKYHMGCVFCGSADGIVEYKDRLVCRKCIESMKRELSR